MDNYSTLNEILVNLFHDIMDIEQKAIITPEFSDITNNDMHVIEAIGLDNPKNMSTIAKELSITVGTLTIAMNSLVKKGYVHRERSEEDRRVVYISLSEKGKRAYRHHEKFHHEMIQSILEYIEPDETEILVRTLTKLNQWFRSRQGEEEEKKEDKNKEDKSKEDKNKEDKNKKDKKRELNIRISSEMKQKCERKAK